MRPERVVQAAALALGAALFAAVTPAGAVSLVVVPAAPGAGQTAQLSASGLRPGAHATIRLSSAGPVRARADRRGRLSVELAVPRSWRAGPRALVLRSARGTLRARVSILRRGSTATSALAVLSGGRRFVVGATRAAVGSRVRVRAGGLRRRTGLTVRIGGRRAAIGRSDGGGRADLWAVVPPVTVGAHVLEVRGRGRGRGTRLSLRFYVVAAQSPAAVPAPGAPAPAPAPGAPATLTAAAAGDIACGAQEPGFNGGGGTADACRQAATAAAIDGVRADAVLPLGDLQYPAGAASDFAAGYGPSWGRFDALAFPVPGDQDYGQPGAVGYFGYFGRRAGDPAKGYYSYDLGGWHVIALNSICDAGVPCASGSAQEQWLRADLAAHPSACTLAYWHRPRFTSGPPAQATETAPFWDDLYAAGADVVLGANAHNYERFAPQTPDRAPDPAHGIREFVVGTGGRSHEARTVSPLRPNSETGNDDTFGVLALTLRPSGYEWRFVPEAGATLTDSGSESCR